MLFSMTGSISLSCDILVLFPQELVVNILRESVDKVFDLTCSILIIICFVISISVLCCRAKQTSCW